MLHTGFFTHRSCAEHEMGSWHPECPGRLAAIHDHLIATGISPHLEHLDAPEASDDALARAHDAAYIERLKTSVPQQGYWPVDPDTSMNPRTWEAALRSAGAVIEATDRVMRKELANAFCAVRPLEAALKQAEANLARDSAQLRNTREQLKRYAELVEKQYVSREQYDQIKTNADAAESVVEADKAAVENAKVKLSYCYIYSPIDGRVGALLIDEGNLVRVNDGASLVIINQINPIHVTFAVPESNLADLKRHMAQGTLQLDVRFPSDEGQPERGRLDFVDNAVDRSTGTIRLKGIFANSQRRLWPGQFINVALTLATEAGAVVVARHTSEKGHFAGLKRAPGNSHRRGEPTGSAPPQLPLR